MADEGGVWRTISGRRVFIKDGQSLTDAMKESGKFKGKESPGEEPNSENIKKDSSDSHEILIYGKAEGQRYRVLTGNEYELTGEKTGETVKVPENEVSGVTVYEVPKCNGFLDGKYVRDENRNAILSNGRIVLNYDAFNNERRSQIQSMIESETMRLSGLKEEGYFFRGTDNKNELGYIKSGTLRTSTNHLTGDAEDGVSAWEVPKYGFKYTYRVKGDVVGIGSDGEPVLDPKSIKLADSKNYTMSVQTKYREIGKQAFMEKYNWTEEQYETALSGSHNEKRRLF